MVVPLKARVTTMGAATFAAVDGRDYGPQDLLLAEDLALRAALAIDNARLYENLGSFKMPTSLAALEIWWRGGDDTLTRSGRSTQDARPSHWHSLWPS